MVKLKKSKDKFRELVEKGQEQREKELIEMHPNEIDDDSAAS